MDPKKINWSSIRAEYEIGIRSIRYLAKSLGVSERAVRKHAILSDWRIRSSEPGIERRGGARPGAGRKPKYFNDQEMPTYGHGGPREGAGRPPNFSKFGSCLGNTYIRIDGSPRITIRDLNRQTHIPYTTLLRWRAECIGPLVSPDENSYDWIEVREFLLGRQCAEIFKNYCPRKLKEVRIALLAEDVALAEQTIKSIGGVMKRERESNVRRYIGVERDAEHSVDGLENWKGQQFERESPSYHC